jgi:2-polyprenyl-3-methyl-5-hydroxy-6-metoxy-1,4-benzoquinol methylase
MNINLNKHIWEGWTVESFIIDLEPILDMIMAEKSYQKIKNSKELKEWLKSNQPYYKKHIPEVYNYFKDKYKL